MSKIILSLIIFFFHSLLLSQNLSPTTKDSLTTFYYYNNQNLQINSVAVAGSFNKWDPKKYRMEISPKTQIWSIDIQLPLGIEYLYKFVINDTLWITDPNAPDVTEDEWRNGIIVANTNEYFSITEINPPRNKRVTSLDDFYFKLIPFDKNFDKDKIEIYIDDNKIEYSIKNDFNYFFRTPKNLAEGEHRIFVKLTGVDKLLFSSNFYLDQVKAKIQTPKFFNDAIMYEIFVRTFCDSNSDGIGDLRGVEAKLDYLKKLNVDAIWLMPICEGPTEHGYNINDYYKIESDYGTMDDFIHLIRECKKRKIKVIFDWVINHSDISHPFFQDAMSNPKSKYSKWYQFTDSTNTNWRHFGIEKNMPKFNFENKEVWEYFIQNVLFWMDPNGDGKFDDGIDGVRCDAAKEVPHTFWNYLRKIIKGKNKNFLLLAEVWDSANYLIPFFEDEFDMCFDYPFYYALQDFLFKDKQNAIQDILNKERDIYPENFQMVKFLSNHDNHRALSLFEQDTLKYIQALIMIYTLPGMPMIYYGDEMGFKGKTPPENVRQKMVWNFRENYEKIFNVYQVLGELRKTNKVLSNLYDTKNNSITFLQTSKKEVFCYLRYDKRNKFLIIINNSNEYIESLKFEEEKIKKGKILFSKSIFLRDRKNKLIIDINKLSLEPRDFYLIQLK